MRIVIATPLYPPESGGPATYTALLEQGLPALGVEVRVVKFTDVRYFPTIVRHLVYGLRVARALHDADLLYILDPVSVGLPGMIAAWFRRKPYVVKIVGDYAWEQGRQHSGVRISLDEFVTLKRVAFPLNLYRAIQTRVAKRAVRVIVPSRYLKNIVEAWGIPTNKIFVIHNAIRAEAANAIPPKVRALPKPLIVSIGRLVPWKGFSDLIAAVAALRAKGIPASLAIVGDGPESGVLEEKAAQMLRTDFVLTGQLPHAQAYDVLLAADVFVLDSLYEGLSHTLIEALVAGVPVVVSDIGGNREIIQDEENGLIVAPENPAALASALERLLIDDALRLRLAASSKASGVHFSVETMIKKTAQNLAELA